MIRRIQLENFKAFEKADLDFTDGNLGKANSITLIYGPNGGGKSSLVDSLAFLKLSTMTLCPYEGADLGDMAAASRRRGSDGRVKLRFWISNGEEDGEYLTEFGPDGRIVHERLDYTINKNSGCIYDLSTEEGPAFSRQLFKSVSARDAIEYEVRKNWGKHTFLSIVRREMQEYGEARLSDLLGTGILGFIGYVDGIIVCRPGNENLGPSQVERFPESGFVEDMESLNAFARVADRFVPSLFKEYASASYETDSYGRYRLMLRKRDSDEDVPLEEESQGLREAVRLLPGLLKAAGGGVAVVDDVEHCLHEIVLKTVFERCLDNASGQLIATTHNTSLLEDANPHGVFMMDKGKATPITSIERTQKNHNNRARYFKGVFGAIPDPEPVDLAELAGLPANKNII